MSGFWMSLFFFPSHDLDSGLTLEVAYSHQCLLGHYSSCLCAWVSVSLWRRDVWRPNKPFCTTLNHTIRVHYTLWYSLNLLRSIFTAACGTNQYLDLVAVSLSLSRSGVCWERVRNTMGMGSFLSFWFQVYVHVLCSCLIAASCLCDVILDGTSSLSKFIVFRLFQQMRPSPWMCVDCMPSVHI